MRNALAAMAFACAAAGAAFAEDAHDVSGAWDARETDSEYTTPDYFDVDLMEREGRLAGRGHINLCAGCRGWEHYEIDWQGRLYGDRIELYGVHPGRPLEEPVRFEGKVSADGLRVVGTLTQGAYRRSQFVMLRAPQAADAPPTHPSAQ